MVNINDKLQEMEMSFYHIRGLFLFFIKAIIILEEEYGIKTAMKPFSVLPVLSETLQFLVHRSINPQCSVRI